MLFTLLRTKGRDIIRFHQLLNTLTLRPKSGVWEYYKTTFLEFMHECENEYAIHPEKLKENFILPTTPVYMAIFYRYQERKKDNNSSHFFKAPNCLRSEFLRHQPHLLVSISCHYAAAHKLHLTGCNLIISEGKGFAKLFKIPPQPYPFPQSQVNFYPYPKTTPLSDMYPELLQIPRKQHYLSCWSSSCASFIMSSVKLSQTPQDRVLTGVTRSSHTHLQVGASLRTQHTLLFVSTESPSSCSNCLFLEDRDLHPPESLVSKRMRGQVNDLQEATRYLST